MTELLPRTSRLDFGTSSSAGLYEGLIFQFFNMEMYGVFILNRITQKVVWMNVHEIFERDRPSEKEHSIRFWD